jgi:uncharacterized membrane protein
MTEVQWAQALSCVVIVSLGQVLFRLAGLQIEAAGTWFHARGLAWVMLSVTAYAGATILWIQLLRHAALTQVYPLMGLSFVVVPLLSVLVLRESITLQFVAGSVLIATGVALTFLAR